MDLYLYICIYVSTHPFTTEPLQDIVEGTVMGRIGKASDMAGASLFLTSQAGAFVTGAVLVVDGGILVKPRL